MVNMVEHDRRHPEAPSGDTIRGRIRKEIAALLKCAEAEVDLDKPFEQLGLSSLEGMMLLGDMELWLGVEIPPTEILEHATLAEYCDHLARQLR
jgi:acyl carrier protein